MYSARGYADMTRHDRFPDSEIYGSIPAYGCTVAFRGFCHVLHRLLVPRHPPNALQLDHRKSVRQVDRCLAAAVALLGATRVAYRHRVKSFSLSTRSP